MMRRYYCHSCASSMGELRDVCSSGLFSSTYQLDKYIKHTIPDPHYPYQSVFDNVATTHYRESIVNTACAGAVEYDEMGRKNLIYVATTGRIGGTFVNGVFVRANDTIKVVLPSDPTKVHAFTESSTEYNTSLCGRCGAPIVH